MFMQIIEQEIEKGENDSHKDRGQKHLGCYENYLKDIK